MFKFNNKDTRVTSLGVFIVNFEHYVTSFLLFLLLALNK